MYVRAIIVNTQPSWHSLLLDPFLIHNDRRLQAGDLSKFVGVRCILTMQFHHRDDETPRDYVAVAAISAEMRLGPRFSHRTKTALNESLDIPRILHIASEWSTAWYISFSDSNLLFKRKKARKRTHGDPRLNIRASVRQLWGSRVINYARTRNRYRKSRFIFGFAQILYKLLASCSPMLKFISSIFLIFDSHPRNSLSGLASRKIYELYREIIHTFYSDKLLF